MTGNNNKKRALALKMDIVLYCPTKTGILLNLVCVPIPTTKKEQKRKT